MKRALRVGGVAFLALAFAWACGFDNSLREYLSAKFWLPFAKRGADFERRGVRRVSAPFAGMTAVAGQSPLAKLRAAYQTTDADVAPLLTALRADRSLTPREREEVDLIDAKLDMRIGEPEDSELLGSAMKKLQAFLATAKTPELLSEARGWIAHIHFLAGNQAAAGKIYLDELNRNGSNLSRETLLTSLQMNYGYDGGPQLREHLEEYFDTPEHAAFAIQLATNPKWDRYERNLGHAETSPPPDEQVTRLLEKHKSLLRTNAGANALALLGMRTALRDGNPPAARKIADAVPAQAAVRADPDFNWMLASAHFLSKEYAAAEAPLLKLFRSPRASDDQKAAAAYGLCGVYWKIGNTMEQLRFALWLHTAVRVKERYLSSASESEDLSVYWAISGWDLGMILEGQAPLDTLQAFVEQNPKVPDLRLVQYAIAVQLTRESRYREAAEIYESIHAIRRTPRLRKLADLYEETTRSGSTDAQKLEAKYKMAEFLVANSNGVYYNDSLWHGYQGYAFQASDDSRLTRAERQSLMDAERKLKDEQEERWRAYLILRDVVRDAGDTDLARRSAALAVRSIRGIGERFGRREEIRRADLELSRRAR